MSALPSTPALVAACIVMWLALGLAVALVFGAIARTMSTDPDAPGTAELDDRTVARIGALLAIGVMGMVALEAAL